MLTTFEDNNETMNFHIQEYIQEYIHIQEVY